MPLITRMHTWAQRAGASKQSHAQPSAHLNGHHVSTSLKPKTKQAAHTSVAQGQLKLWLWHWTNARNLAIIRFPLWANGQQGPLAFLQIFACEKMVFANATANATTIF